MRAYKTLCLPIWNTLQNCINGYFSFLLNWQICQSNMLKTRYSYHQFQLYGIRKTTKWIFVNLWTSNSEEHLFLLLVLLGQNLRNIWYLIFDSTKLFRLQRDKLGLRITRSDDCQTLQDAVQRYLDYIFTCFNDNYENNLRNVFDEDLRKKMLLSPELSVRDTILITSLIIHLKSCSYWPDLASKESC